MATIDDGGPAFPIPIAGCGGSVYNALEQSSGKLGGISMRDYFATHASEEDIQTHVQQLVKEGSRRLGAELRERARYHYADAMLAARGQPGER